VIWQAALGAFVVAIVAALPFTFQPPIPRPLAVRVGRRYAGSLALGGALFVVLVRTVSWHLAWAAGLVVWAGLMVVTYIIWAHRERSGMWGGLATTLAAACVWFVALVSRADTAVSYGAKIALLALSAGGGVFGMVTITQGVAPWVGRRR
jgi:hypothetical protein